MTHPRSARRRAGANGGNGHDYLPPGWDAQACLESAPTGIHCVGPDGTILWANKAQTEMLGYAAIEYVGHNIAEFHPDTDAVQEMLARLTRGEILQGHDAELRCRDGAIRYVLIDSSPAFEGDRFLHSRCFTRDITERMRAEQRLAVQYQVVSALAESEGLHEAGYAVLALMCGYLGWRLGALWSVDEKAGVLRCVETWCMPEPDMRAFEAATHTAVFAEEEGLPGRVWATGAPEWIPDVAVDRNFARAPYAAKAGLHAALGFPIKSAGRVIGVIEFLDGEIREPDRELVAMMTAIGGQLGQFMRVRMVEAETALDAQARKGVEQEHGRGEEEQRFLANVSSVVNASLDYEKALGEVAALAVPFLADWCSVHVTDSRGSLFPVLLVHSEPERTAEAKDAGANVTVDPDGPFGVAVAVRTRKPVLYNDVPRMVEEHQMDGKQPQFAESLGIKSAVMIPLEARGRVLGAISLLTAESGRMYTEADLPLIEEFARRASLAADNARLYSDVQLASSAKDEFLGLVSHELRTPLTGIYGAVRILRMRGQQLAPADRDDLLDVLEHESERMNQLVEDLLVLSRLDLGQEVMLEPVMPARVVQKVVAGLNYIKGPREIGVELQPGLPPAAAEPSLLEQVLRNLLNNAQKYSPAGTPIEVRAAESPDGGVSVSVLDRGVGIAPEEAERIFEPFYRSPTAAMGKGLGIGLTVCKRLTQAQGGYIWAKPREGGGVEIGFTLKRYEDDSPGP